MRKNKKINTIIIIATLFVISSALLITEYTLANKSIVAFANEPMLFPVMVTEVVVEDRQISNTPTTKTIEELVATIESLGKEYDTTSYKTGAILKGFIGVSLTETERHAYVDAILKAVKGKEVGHFKESVVGNSEAYYAYTNKIKIALKDEMQQKFNLQISFYEDKKLGTTLFTIAIPFDNNTF